MKNILLILTCFSVLFSHGCIASSRDAESSLFELSMSHRGREALRALLEVLEEEGASQEKAVTLDYGQCSIADFRTPYVRHYSEVLQAMAEQEAVLSRYPGDLTITLAGNYLQDEGVQGICRALLESRYLRDNLVKLDLSNNRFTDKSLPLLRSVLDNCPKLKTLDISVSYVNFASFNSIFGDLSDQQKQKVTFSIY